MVELCYELYAIADAEDGRTDVEDGRVETGCVHVVDARGPARQYDAGRFERPYAAGAYIIREYLAVDAQLPDLSRYQLCVLGAEIEDSDDFLMVVAKVHTLSLITRFCSSELLWLSSRRARGFPSSRRS